MLLLGALGMGWTQQAPAVGAAPDPDIKVDQVGYLPSAAKLALVTGPDRGDGTFLVRGAGDGDVAFRGTLTSAVDDALSGDRVRAADFSPLRAPGRYVVEVAGVGTSWPFTIAPRAYSRAWHLAMRSFYGQRCNTAVDLGPEFPGYRYGVCHRSAGFHPSSGREGAGPSSGGWHDAGDYGRYVVNSGIATGTLLLAWELYSERLDDVRLDIPESGDAVPDVLDEIRWNLNWMASMQDTDGGVWHKQTSEQFAPFVMPDRDELVSYVIGIGRTPYKSSCATADFGAVMAMAARAYRGHDERFATRARDAAVAAWRWLEANPEVRFENPAGVVTGEYGDADCGDERLWAAAELWRTTREARYGNHVREGAGAYAERVRSGRPPSWSFVAPLAFWTCVLAGDGDPAQAGSLRRDVLSAARLTAGRTARSPYRTSLTSDDYVWGSNGVAANYGVQLLVANRIEPDRAFLHAARDNLHYLLGRNTFSLSWVTGVGANPFRHPHHRPSGADSNPEPWPGLLSGGPNRRPQDPAMERLPDLPPARMYLDDQESYASNEIAINWNAPLVLLLAGVGEE